VRQDSGSYCKDVEKEKLHKQAGIISRKGAKGMQRRKQYFTRRKQRSMIKA